MNSWSKPRSVVLVPIAEAPSKRSPKIVLFDVMSTQNQKAPLP